jgi:hypothetical protein
MADVFVARSRDSQAERMTLAGQLVVVAQRVLGTVYELELDDTTRLVQAHRDAARAAEMIPLFKQMLAERDVAQHVSDLRSTWYGNHLAGAYLATGRVTEAITVTQRVLAEMEAAHVEPSLGISQARNNLAAVYRRGGRSRDAIPLCEASVRVREQLLGGTHPYSLRSRELLALCYLDVSRAREAIQVFEQVLKDRVRTLGECHPDTLRSRRHLAEAFQQVVPSLKSLDGRLARPPRPADHGNCAHSIHGASRSRGCPGSGSSKEPRPRCCRL